MQTKDIMGRIKEDNVKYVQLQFTDIYGIVKSLTISVRHLPNALEHGAWFDGSSIEGFARIAESDMYLKPDIRTYAVIPWLNSNAGNTARFICDIHKPDGTPFEGDPRFILKKTINKARKMGFAYYTGPELEFFLFKKDNGNINPLPHDHGGYFDLTTDDAYKIRRDMTEALEKFGIDVEVSHHEVALGQHEISFKYGSALRTADNAVTLRFVLKAIAQQNGLHATFMPKPIAGINGSGMHVHQSLFNIETNRNVFYDENNKYKLSKTAFNFIAGQLKHVREMSAVLSPTVNSYKRLTPGYEAPVYISWASTNRSALIRVPRFFSGKTQAARIELRNPDPSCNVYLAFTCMLEAGLNGIKNNLTPPPPVEEDIYDFNEDQLTAKRIGMLPYSLWQAIKEMRNSLLVKNALGEHTFNRYIEAKTKEWDEFRLQVTAWEREKYLEKY
ncbi:MAG: type I glutamate--ammonia ligase [Patescibacteria group bacterium]|jgi:glutamine synthetase